MFEIKINAEAFNEALDQAGISGMELARRLVTEHKPSKRMAQSWASGRPVGKRWRSAIAEHFGVSPKTLFPKKDGCMDKDVMERHSIDADTLANVTLKTKVTRAAVTIWRRGGGIEPDRLSDLAKILGVRQRDLLSADTLRRIDELVN